MEIFKLFSEPAQSTWQEHGDPADPSVRPERVLSALLPAERHPSQGTEPFQQPQTPKPFIYCQKSQRKATDLFI